MKYFLPCFCLLLTCFAAQAQQCDYSTLIKDGRALFEKQQYRAAIKKFNAARTCDPSKSAEVDQEVDRVFNAIEEQRDEAKRQRDEAKRQRDEAKRQREEALTNKAIAEDETRKREIERDKANAALALANVMRDSAMLANEGKSAAEEKTALLTELYDLQIMADNNKNDRNYKEAISYYNKLITRLDKVAEKDSILTQKYALVSSELQKTQGLLEKQQQFNALIDSADQYKRAGMAWFPEAYRFYLDAAALQYDSLLVLRRLSQLELTLGENIKPNKDLKGVRYYHLLNRSAEANLLMGSAPFALNRISRIAQYRPNDIEFIENEELSKYYNSYNNKFKHRFGLYYGIRVLTPNISQSRYRYENLVDPLDLFELNLIFKYLIGCNIDFKNGRSGLTLEVGNYGLFLQNSYSINGYNSEYYYSLDASLSYYHNLFTIFSKKWNNKILDIQGKLGVGIGTTSINYGPWYGGDFIVPNNLRATFKAEEYTNIFLGSSQLVGQLEYKIYDFDYFKQSGRVGYTYNPYYDFDVIYKNVSIGLRLVCYPFTKKSFYLLCDSYFGVQILTKKITIENDLRNEIIAHFQPTYQNAGADWEAFKQGIPSNVVRYPNNFPELNNSGLVLQFGIGHRF